MDNNEPNLLDRRTVTTGAAWSVPVVLAAVAAPAAKASTPPNGTSDPCKDGRMLVEPAPGGSFQTNSGEGATTVTGPGVSLVNTSDAPLPMGVTLKVTGGEATLEAPAYRVTTSDTTTTTVTVPARSSVLVLVTTRNGSAGFLTLDCGKFNFPKQ